MKTIPGYLTKNEAATRLRGTPPNPHPHQPLQPHLGL